MVATKARLCRSGYLLNADSGIIQLPTVFFTLSSFTYMRLGQWVLEGD